MHIEQVQCHLLRLPLSRPVLSSGKGDTVTEHLALLVVQLRTDNGPEGLGFAWTHRVGGGALHALAVDDLAPLFSNEDPLDNERLSAKTSAHFQELGRTSLVARAFAAFDIALWDIKAKVAGLPLHKLLGGARSGVPAYAGDVGWRWMSPKQVVEAAQPYLNRGLTGVKVHVGRTDPEEDAQRLTYIREALGEESWAGSGRRPAAMISRPALLMGEFLEEQGMDWFEEPIAPLDMTRNKPAGGQTSGAVGVTGQCLDTVAEFLPFLKRGLGEVMQLQCHATGRHHRIGSKRSMRLPNCTIVTSFPQACRKSRSS